MAAPAASGPVFGATAPILMGSAPKAAPIENALLTAAAAASLKTVLRLTLSSSSAESTDFPIALST
jgi:hypothetical protein